jgi:ComF family protein
MEKLYMWSLINHVIMAGAPCLLCRTPTDSAAGFCAGCLADLPLTGPDCLHCGMPQPAPGSCPCCPTAWPFAAVLSAAYYAFPVDHLIHRFKETPCHEHARPLAWLLAARVRRHDGPRPQLLLPVPAAADRLKQRGFDQALELARETGRLLGIPVRRDAFSRQSGLPAQKGLNAARRETNIRQAFSADNLRDLPAHVALVDDVLTTGATVRHLGGLLQRAGVEMVEVWTLARAL